MKKPLYSGGGGGFLDHNTSSILSVQVIIDDRFSEKVLELLLFGILGLKVMLVIFWDTSLVKGGGMSFRDPMVK